MLPEFVISAPTSVASNTIFLTTGHWPVPIPAWTNPRKSVKIRGEMKLIINGDQREFSAPNLAALIEQLGMKTDRVAVELNLNIVPRDRWAATELHDGDKLEIVHFVGGG